MDDRDVSRRDFNRLTAAAFGGLVTGALAGCNNKPDAKPADSAPADGGESLLLSGKNVCRGLNTCKNHNGGTNECAGMGSCATAEKHDCAGDNACKGQGGCGANPGQNECKGKGGCHVPLMESAWKKARASFETAYKAKHGKEPGAAPAAAAPAKES